jgi:hypothetical protein
VLTGSAVFTDTAQGLMVLGDYIVSNRNTGSMVATEHPVMAIRQENDSTFIAADTLYTGRLSDLPVAPDSLSANSQSNDSTMAAPVASAPRNRPDSVNQNDSANRYFRAYYHVRIFSDSLQAVCDSLFYSGKDSVFRLFRDPIVWSARSQVTGDTIYMYTKNKQPDQMYVFENGLMVNETAPNMYNQVKGNRIFGYFKDGQIDYIRAKGSAESIYYVMDEYNKLIGINKANSDIIDMRFKNKELNRVVLISTVTAKMLPFKDATDQDRRLRNFKWQEERRPKTKFELLQN